AAGIPSIVLPTDPIERAYWGDVRLKSKHSQITSTCQQANQTKLEISHQPSVLFYLDSLKALNDLKPLICQFNQLSTIDVHLITHQPNVTVDCHKSVWIHPVDLLYRHPDWQQFEQLPMRWKHLFTSIQPHLIIHTSPMMRAMQTITNVTSIYLPSQEIQHALWMTDLSLDTLTKWHQIDIKLIVTTDKKPHALSRLLTSASEAYYLGDSVDLSLLLDVSSDRLTHTFAHRFSWSHGQKSMRHRIAHSSKASLFVESWYPSHRHEYAILLHQDLELSPLFYSWAKYSVLKYRYQSDHPDLFGISLYAPRLIETDPSGRHLFHQRPSSDYLMQWPSYLGALYFPDHWREFHDYITARQADTWGMAMQSVVVPNLRSNDWVKSWRRYFEELVYLRGYVMLYPQTSYATVHMELKKKFMTHFGDALSLYQVPLANTTHSLLNVDQLPLFDIWGHPIDQKTLKDRGLALQNQVSACLPSIAPEDKFDPTDLLCPFGRIVSVELENEDDPIPSLLPKEIHVYL
ncbi:hypothetical protein A0J61_07726, partial [Choanephora cucurbitarum]